KYLGAPFAHYDNHRWRLNYKHDGQGPLLFDPSDLPFGDDEIEVCYNSKRSNHENLKEGAFRIVFKFKSDVPFKVLQYLNELPDNVEEWITKDKTIKEKEKKNEEERISATKEFNKEKVEKSASKTASSRFGRQRKPNRRYVELYKLDSAAKNQRNEDVDLDSDVSYNEDNFDESGDEYDVQLTSRNKDKVKGRSYTKKDFHERSVTSGSQVWMAGNAGYVQEKSKPKNLALFTMCDSDDQGDIDLDVKSMQRDSEHKIVEQNVIPTSWQNSILDQDGLSSLIEYGRREELMHFEKKIPPAKLGDIFIVHKEYEVDKKWHMHGKIVEEDFQLHYYGLVEETALDEECISQNPNILLLYNTSGNEFCLVHFLQENSPGAQELYKSLEKWDDTSTKGYETEKDTNVKSSSKIDKSYDGLSSNKKSQTVGKSLGRPRFQGLLHDTDLEETEMDKEKEEGRKEDYDSS
ncbi:unnamed protein product, partial [Meganyctiphanes norvegica]